MPPSLERNALERIPRQHTTMEQRLRAEWLLLNDLVRLNPTRLRAPRQEDNTFLITLLKTPAVPMSHEGAHTATDHEVRVLFPLHFPALPMEAYLGSPVFHPNVHPETGFLCLWDRHTSTNTIEHALHKTAAMLGWQLLTTDPQHVMQLDAAQLAEDCDQLAAMRARLNAPPLLGVAHHDGYVSRDSAAPLRRRLS